MSEVVEQILDLARWAPSGDNTQPWRFEILSESHIVIHGFDTREHCVYDLNGFGSQLAHGALLETICIAATGFGLRAETSLRHASPDTHPVYDVRLYPDKQAEVDPLFPFITQRCTQRRLFSIRSLAFSDKQALTASISHHPYTILWLEDWKSRWTMAKLLFATSKIRLTIPEAYDVHRNIIQWNASGSEDRIPDKAVGLDPLTLRIMRWAMASWERIDFLNSYFAGHVLPRIELDLLPALFCASHFIILRNEEPSGIEDNIEAGCVVQRFWLTAARLGLQLQPEMACLIFMRYARQGIPLSRIESATQRSAELAGVLEHLTEKHPGKIMFIGRTGYGKPPKARSLRLPLVDLQWSSTKAHK